MLGCSTVCPNCKHQFQCCSVFQECCRLRRSLHGLSGGGIVAAYPSPQVSPSLPLTFILPPLGTMATLPNPPAAAVVEAKPQTDMERLLDTVQGLRRSGWYYEGITYQRGHELLKGSEVGTFLVRNSSDPNFLFSLSVQTDRGPTSVRIYYGDSFFRLDSQPHLQKGMPLFKNVIDLVYHYIKYCRVVQQKNPQMWVDPVGKWYSKIKLKKPLRKQSEPPSLKHLSRLAIHKALEAVPKLAMLPAPHTQLELPTSLIAYLSEYPYPF